MLGLSEELPGAVPDESGPAGAGHGGAARVQSTRVDSLSAVLEKYKLELKGDDTLYTLAFNQFAVDLALLIGSSVQLDKLIKRFSEAFLERGVVNSSRGKTCFDGIAAKFDLRYSPGAVGDVDVTKIGQDIVESFNVVEGQFAASNLQEMMRLVVDTMHGCHERVSLSYHNPGHAFEMMADVPRQAKMNKVKPDWALLLSICGLFHDAIFLRERVKDEQHSAELLLTALNPFIRTLAKTDQDLFAAFVRVMIVGGTLPVFLAKDKSMQIKALWEVYVEYNPDLSVAGDLLKACRAMSDSDVQRTLTVELLRDFPLSTPVPVSEILVGIVDQYVQENESRFAHIDVNAEDAKLMILTKLGQSMRMTAELKSPGQVTEPLVPVKAKMMGCLRSGAEWVDFSPDDLSAFNGLIGGEKFFADMNLNGLRLEEAPLKVKGAAGVDMPALRKSSMSNRRSSFVVESWDWHKGVYDLIKTKMSEDEGAAASPILKALLDNARNQQGLRIDMSKFMHSLIPVAESAASPASLGSPATETPGVGVGAASGSIAPAAVAAPALAAPAATASFNCCSLFSRWLRGSAAVAPAPVPSSTAATF